MPPTSHVVVAYDLSRSGRAALERSLALATRAPWHVLHVVCVIDPRAAFPALPARRVDAAYVADVRRTLAALVAGGFAARGATGVSYVVHALTSKRPATTILHVAREVGAELIIVGTKGLTGLERALVGSIAQRVVRDAHCTVEVARAEGYANRRGGDHRASLRKWRNCASPTTRRSS